MEYFKASAAYKLVGYKPYKQRFIESRDSFNQFKAMKDFLFFQTSRSEAQRADLQKIRLQNQGNMVDKKVSIVARIARQ